MQAEEAIVLRRLRQAAPGVVLVLALAGAAKLGAIALAHISVAGTKIPVSSILCAVILGTIWRNLVGVSERCEAGLSWVMHNLLRAGIALVGLRLTLLGITGIVATAVPVVIACICTALVIGLSLARTLDISKQLGQLLAVGTAVCGCTAVIAMAPVIGARHHETGFAVACVVLFGCIGMLLHPTIAHLLFAQSSMHAGVFLGTAIHDTSQVIGAGLIYSEQYSAPDALAAASVTKLLRNLSIAVLIPAAAWLQTAGASQPRTQVRTEALPTFVIVFVLLVVVRSIGDAYLGTNTGSKHPWEQFIASAEQICELLLICGMTAVGLSVSVGHLRRVGLRPLTAGAIVAVAVGLCSASLTLLMQRLL